MFRRGTRVQRFEVLGHIGTGGMGSVFRAHDPQLDRDVAIKVVAQVTPELAAYVTATETVDLRSAPARDSSDDLMREARMMARLSHPNVLAVYEVGLSDSSVFLVTEHIDGSDLRSWLETPRTTAEILDVFRQAGDGLAAAHERGIVHRDFKPDNVLVGVDGRVRVADFGLSRLVIPTHAMRRVDEAHGTPRYMAPELWRGEPATPKSDVFAFCVALAEAFGVQPGADVDRVLRERGVATRLRKLVIAGFDEEPVARPELGHVLAALALRPMTSRRRTWIAAAVIALGVAPGGYMLLASSSSSTSCEPDPKVFEGRWNAAVRTSLVTTLRARATPATVARVDGVVAAADAAQRGVLDEWVATCKAANAGKVLPAQAAARRSCLERRAIELGEAVRSIPNFPATPSFVLRADDRLDAMVPATDCGDMETQPRTADREAVAALYARLYAGDQRPTAEQVGLATALEADALKLGEQEVAARAAQWRGLVELRTNSDDAGATLQRVLRYASDLKWTNLQAGGLVERSRLGVFKQDAATAKSFAELAKPLADKPIVTARSRAKIYIAMGEAAAAAGDYANALTLLRNALEIVQARKRQTSDEISIRSQLVKLESFVGEPPAEVIADARENIEFVRSVEGDRSRYLAQAYSELSAALQNADHRKEAVPYARKALEIAIEVNGPQDPDVAIRRESLAIALGNSGEYEASRVELMKLADEYEKNPAHAQDRARLLAALATASFSAGHHDEALAFAEQGIEESASQYGIDHPATLGLRFQRVWMELEVEHYDDAMRHIDALERSYRKQPGEPSLFLIVLDGYNRARVLLFGRGKAKEAEAKTRAAMARFAKVKPDDPRILSELGGADIVNCVLPYILAQSLVEQKRFAEARVQLDSAHAIASKSRMLPPNQLAAIEIWLAYVDEAEGKREDALARLARAKPILLKQRSDIFEMKRLEALHARLTK